MVKLTTRVGLTGEDIRKLVMWLQSGRIERETHLLKALAQAPLPCSALPPAGASAADASAKTAVPAQGHCTFAVQSL